MVSSALKSEQATQVGCAPEAMPYVNTGLCDSVKSSFLTYFPPERVVTLLAYGSSIYTSPPRDDDVQGNRSDLDVYLLLDRWHDTDDIVTRQAAEGVPGYHVDLGRHYADELPDPCKFRFVTKSCLTLAYLASAELLHGKNIPGLMFEELPHAALQTSALEAVFYYLELMQREMATYTDEAAMTRRLTKYVTRSLIDAMLFSAKTTYEPFKYLDPDGIFALASGNSYLKDLMKDADLTTNTGKLVLLRNLHMRMRLTSWQIAGATGLSPTL